MALGFNTLLDRLTQRRGVRRWARAARRAATMDLATLRNLRRQGRQLRRHIDQVSFVAEGRLALPLIGSDAIQKPMYTDWAYRPQLWRGPIDRPGMASVQSKTMFGDEATVFHDCKISELTLRQLRNQREEDLAPFGLRMDVFRFDGSFLSLVVDLPEDSVVDLRKTHLIRLSAIVELEKTLEIFARLNIKHGPNTEQVVRELPLHEDEVMVEFDLAYTNLNEKRVDKIWVDLIFEGPEMNQIILRDLTFTRRPRAEI